MDAPTLLDDLLRSGRELARQGQALAEKQLQIPESGPDRERMLTGLGKGAAIGGLMALLLGTHSGRRITGSAVKLGGLAALGGVAYKAFRDWQARQGANAELAGRVSVDRLSGPESERRSLALLKAMIGAAKADGHIDADERTQLEGQLQKLGSDSSMREFLQREIAAPLVPADIAASADTPETAIEIYLVSLAVIDRKNEPERAYLAELAAALKLEPSLLEILELQAGSEEGVAT